MGRILAGSRNFDLTQTVDADGRAIQYTYDKLGRETQEDWYASVDQSGNPAGGPTETINYAYDHDGNLTSASDHAATYAFSYYASGNLDQTTVSGLAGLADSRNSVTLGQTWDNDGNRTSLSASLSLYSGSTCVTTPDFANTYSYDSLGRMQSVLQSGQSGGDAVSTKLVDFGYDPQGRLWTVQRYADSGGTEEVAESTYSYDGNSNITGLLNTIQGQTLVNESWQYKSRNGDAASILAMPSARRKSKRGRS